MAAGKACIMSRVRGRRSHVDHLKFPATTDVMAGATRSVFPLFEGRAARRDSKGTSAAGATLAGDGAATRSSAENGDEDFWVAAKTRGDANTRMRDTSGAAPRQGMVIVLSIDIDHEENLSRT
eukprot:IDg10152t1